jgi:hypothetical protein
MVFCHFFCEGLGHTAQTDFLRYSIVHIIKVGLGTCTAYYYLHTLIIQVSIYGGIPNPSPGTTVSIIQEVVQSIQPFHSNPFALHRVKFP